VLDRGSFASQVAARLGANLFHVHDGKVTRLIYDWERVRALPESWVSTNRRSSGRPAVVARGV